MNGWYLETKQSMSETIEQYVTRLRQKAHTCKDLLYFILSLVKTFHRVY